MLCKDKKAVRIAILDLYEGQPNQGMRGIRDILTKYSAEQDLELSYEVFDVRLKSQVPGLDYDIYLSSGGPGSPLESEGTEWEKKYFTWLTALHHYNNHPGNTLKKYVLFICHSFQLACRYFEIGRVTKRKSTAFGVFPVHILENGKDDPVFDGLQDPFYAVDSRSYQVVEPDFAQLDRIGGSLLAIEKERPHIPLERAIMAVRFNKYMAGAQFHPEADAYGMSIYLQTEEKKKTVIQNHGEEKWRNMLEHLSDPDKIMWTYAHILPNFLNQAVEHLQTVEI